MRGLGPLVLLAFASAVAADEVYLVGGGKVTGEIVERTRDTIVLETGPGRVTLSMARVKRIDAGPSALADFRERARALKAGDVEGWMALGRWADDRGLGTQASEAYRRVLAADPANAEANGALGRTEVGGRWLTREEAYREKGLVPFEGSWVTPAEREAALKERAASDLAESNAREAEARVREAEARARTAEAEASRAEAESYGKEGGNEGIPYWPYVYPGGVYFPPQPPCCDPAPTPAPRPRPPAPAPKTSSIHGSERDSNGDATPPARTPPRQKR